MSSSTRPHLIGYVDRFSVAPGQTIHFMVSCSSPTYQADIVRLIHGDPRLARDSRRACCAEKNVRHNSIPPWTYSLPETNHRLCLVIAWRLSHFTCPSANNTLSPPL